MFFSSHHNRQQNVLYRWTGKVLFPASCSETTIDLDIAPSTDHEFLCLKSTRRLLYPRKYSNQVKVLWQQPFSHSRWYCSAHATESWWRLCHDNALCQLQRYASLLFRVRLIFPLGILIGKLTMELGGKVTIVCEKTRYSADIEFKLKVDIIDDFDSPLTLACCCKAFHRWSRTDELHRRKDSSGRWYYVHILRTVGWWNHARGHSNECLSLCIEISTIAFALFPRRKVSYGK